MVMQKIRLHLQPAVRSPNEPRAGRRGFPSALCGSPYPQRRCRKELLHSKRQSTRLQSSPVPPDTEPRPGRNILRAGTAPSAQAGQHEPVRQERRPAGGSSAPVPRGKTSIPHPGPAGNTGNSRASETTRLTAKAPAPTPRADLVSGPVTPPFAKSGKGVPKREKGTVPSRKKRGERT